MMTWSSTPKIILLVFIVTVLVWDVVANVAGHPEATISASLLQMATEHPVVAFALGFLIGHAIWPNKP